MSGFEEALPIRLCDYYGKEVKLKEVDGDYKLPVDAQLSISNLTLPRYRPKFVHDNTNILLNSNYTNILTVDTNGKLDGLVVKSNKNDADYKIIVDGIEVLYLDNSILKDGVLFEPKASIVNFGITSIDRGKTINIKFPNDSSVMSNITVMARSLSSRVNLELYMLTYTELIV